MPRENDFKLGVIHGKIKAHRQELIMQRNLFLMGGLVIKSRRDERSNQQIRIFAYEVPLEHNRGKCIDLLGYDGYDGCHFLYIIELKDSESKEKLSKVENQIREYANKISKVKVRLEEDFLGTFYFKIEFNKEINKLILAPNKFYNQNNVGCRPAKAPDITYLYFKDGDLANLKSNDFDEIKLDRPLHVHIWNCRKTK